MLYTARWRIPDFIRDSCSKLPAQGGPDLLCVFKRHLKQPAANSSFTLMAPFRSYTDLAPLPSQLHPPLSFSSSSVFASFIVVGFISHLAWRGNKRPTQWRNHVILFSHTLPFVFYFCLQRQTLSASRVRDKPSKVLCSEIIWQADKKKAAVRVFGCCFCPPTFSSSLEVLGSSQWCRGLSGTIYQVTPSAKCQPHTFDTRRDA